MELTVRYQSMSIKQMDHKNTIGTKEIEMNLRNNKYVVFMDLMTT